MSPHPKAEAKACFKCDQDVLDDFRRVVAAKHGRLYGVLCLEFEQALKEHLERMREEVTWVGQHVAKASIDKGDNDG